ncbi:MAG TPA: prepilin-type N-terminal cleavage/methylation domain-containing protein [Aquabacterium sp.]|uniref:prepilin-type N-terminal cleavage/methylation domain-containing protein n=1 Tax=Aquabacterium sp. TaxID=1872578 RepID=UPI002E305743|nr:prepilin-type N-terminal cleavage/methylation domain-containing protein [Aquabacterium sp.]HEX5355612.1 prepilin-type N-terminal cleavage/methylation domain-containing protein [Aquabacterium sp.]
MRTSIPMAQRGVTLVELVLVIMIGAIIATTVSLFIKPAIDAYTGSRLRADMSDQADTSLRRMLRDVRRAVPNSIRVPSDQCFELVPVVSGGRYRMAPDNVNDAAACNPQPTPPTAPPASCSAWVDTSQTTMAFDTLSPMSTTPSTGDWVVINNQNGNDVYTGANRSAITAVSTPSSSTQGYKRITMSTMQVSSGYAGGRFLTVSNNEQSVFYICSGADGTLNSNGDGKGTLYRLVRSFTSAYPTSCPSTAGAVALATKVKSCSFIYDPNQGATQQSGFLWMDLEIARNNETAHMAVGAHVMNVP